MNTVTVTHTAPPQRRPLSEHAELLWPDDLPSALHNREAWVKAVAVARQTTRGWIADAKASSKEIVK